MQAAAAIKPISRECEMPSVPSQETVEAWTALGHQLASLRKAAGLTQKTLAPLVRYDRSTIANVETGRQRINRDFWIRCDEELRTSGALAAEYDRIRATMKGQGPGAVTAARAPAGEIGSVASTGEIVQSRDADYLAGEWNSFAALTSMLAQQRQTVSPTVLLGLIEAHRDCLSTLYRKAGRDPVRADIGVMLAEASIVASRLWSAQGNRAMALAHCVSARQLSDRLGNRRTSATARIFESNLHSEAATLIEADGDVMLGLRLLEEAAQASSDLGPAARARIAAEQAQTYASLHLPREIDDALARAEEAVGDLAAADCVGLYSDWNAYRLPVYAGTCHLLLNRPQRSVDLLETAVAALKHDATNTNVTLAASVDLASAYAGIGELEKSFSLLGDTYDHLKAGGNRRGIARAHRALDRLSRWSAEPAFRRLRERMAA